MTVIASVDLAAGWGPVPTQGLRPTCLAFALSELNRYANSASSVLSAEYLYRSAARKIIGWKTGGGLFLRPAAQALAQPGQPTAKACPYLADEPTETPPAIPHLPAEEELYAGTVREVVTNSSKVEAELVDGNPVGLIVRMTDTFYAPVQGTVSFSHMVLDTDMHHAVIATGLGKHSMTSESYIRIRNPWGAGWGDAGNAWLPFEYVNFHAVSAFKV